MVEQDYSLYEDRMTMNLSMMMMLSLSSSSDDNSHIDDNRQDNNNVMNLIRNHHIWFVHIRDEHHELEEVQWLYVMMMMDIHWVVYSMFDHYYNFHLVMEYMSEEKKRKRFNENCEWWSCICCFVSIISPLAILIWKIGQLFKLFERLSVYPITLAW